MEDLDRRSVLAFGGSDRRHLAGFIDPNLSLRSALPP